MLQQQEFPDFQSVIIGVVPVSLIVGVEFLLLLWQDLLDLSDLV